MKWVNKTNTESLDLDKIAYWKFYSKKSAIRFNQNIDRQTTEDDDAEFLVKVPERSSLELYFGGDGPITIDGQDADEIYNLLITTKKEIL